MSGSTALKKINARVKVLAKKHPGKKRTTLQKQAGAEYRAGKLKARRKPAKRKSPKRKAVRRRRHVGAKVGSHKRVVRRRKSVRRRVKRAVSRPRVIVRTRTRTKTVRIASRRRVGSKKSLLPVLAIAGAAVAAYFLLKPKTAPIIYPTGNTYRDSTSQQLLQYAQAAGATATAIAQLVATINAANQSGTPLPDASGVQSIITANSGGDSSTIAGQRLLS